MKKLRAFLVMCLTPSISMADLSDCQNLYVGRIWVENGKGGLYAAVFLNNPGDSGGSYRSYFDGWAADDKKAALTMLMAAKISRHRVNIATTNADGCGLLAGGTAAKDVFLATNP